MTQLVRSRAKDTVQTAHCALQWMRAGDKFHVYNVNNNVRFRVFNSKTEHGHNKSLLMDIHITYGLCDRSSVEKLRCTCNVYLFMCFSVKVQVVVPYGIRDSPYILWVFWLYIWVFRLANLIFPIADNSN